MPRPHRSRNLIAERDYYRFLGLRKKFLRLNPDCVFCMRDLKRKVPATTLDHIRPHKGDIRLFLDMRNFQALCQPCHDRKKKRAEARGYSDEVDANGRYTDPNHPRFGF